MVSWFCVSLLTVCLSDYLIIGDACVRRAIVCVPEWAGMQMEFQIAPSFSLYICHEPST